MYLNTRRKLHNAAKILERLNMERKGKVAYRVVQKSDNPDLFAYFIFG
jgi:hypothetical protein